LSYCAAIQGAINVFRAPLTFSPLATVRYDTSRKTARGSARIMWMSTDLIESIRVRFGTIAGTGTVANCQSAIDLFYIAQMTTFALHLEGIVGIQFSSYNYRNSFPYWRNAECIPQRQAI
jgi:hypothetical protein